MSDEQDKLQLKIEQAEAAVARAQKACDEAEPGSSKDSSLQLLLAKEASLLADKKALEQVREKDLLQQRAAAGVTYHSTEQCAVAQTCVADMQLLCLCSYLFVLSPCRHITRLA